MDDIVDEPGMTPRERHDALNRWVEVINGGAGLELTELEEDIIALIQDLELDTTPMLHLIEGCRSDICQMCIRDSNHIAGQFRGYAGGEFEIGNAQAFTQFQTGDVSGNGFRQILHLADNRQFVNGLGQNAAQGLSLIHILLPA